jgi:hypothetical protein
MQKYLVSYVVVPSVASRRQYRQHAVFLTGELEAIIMGIIPARRRTGRGKIGTQLQEYQERGSVRFGRAGHAGVIKDIVIRKLPERDAAVLAKYL